MNKIICANPSILNRKNNVHINSSIKRVLDSGIYLNGVETKELESEFASYIGCNFAVGVSSGTTALDLAIKSLQLKFDDEIITVSHTAVATVTSILLNNLKPKLVDIEQTGYNISLNEIKSAITNKTKAIIVVHLYGVAAPITEIKELCDRHKLFLIEDCSQAHGAMYRGRRVGSFGDIGCFSCYPTKNLGSLGDAGIVTTNSKDTYNKIKLYREYGWNKNRESIDKGANYRIDEIQAAVLREKLKFLDENNEERRDIANVYNNELQTEFLENRNTQALDSVFHLYVVQVKRRSSLIEFLKGYNIFTGIHYKLPVHMQKFFRDTERLSLVNTESISPEILSLPMYPGLAKEDASRIAGLISCCYQQ